jgi:hypothetical protein
MSVKLGCVGIRRYIDGYQRIPVLYNYIQSLDSYCWIVSVICEILILPEDEPINSSKHVGV